MANINNSNNQYNALLGRLSDRIPKSVFAAIAVSFANILQGEGQLEKAPEFVALEWVLLYENQIVPQRPPQYVFDMAEKARVRADA